MTHVCTHSHTNTHPPISTHMYMRVHAHTRAPRSPAVGSGGSRQAERPELVFLPSRGTSQGSATGCGNPSVFPGKNKTSPFTPLQPRVPMRVPALSPSPALLLGGSTGTGSVSRNRGQRPVCDSHGRVVQVNPGGVGEAAELLPHAGPGHVSTARAKGHVRAGGQGRDGGTGL